MGIKTQDKRKFKHAAHVSWRRVADEVVVLDLKTSAYFALNESGALIWERLGAGASREDVVAAVYGEYEVSLNDASRHVDALIQKLLKAKVLTS